MILAFFILLIGLESTAQAQEPESPDRLALFWNETDANSINSVDQLPNFSIENIQLSQSNSFEYVHVPEINFNSFKSVPEFDIENIQYICSAVSLPS